MIKMLIVAGLLVCLIAHSVSLAARGQDHDSLILRDIRQFLYAPMSTYGSEMSAAAAPSGVPTPMAAPPCQSLDAQYPQQPCSPAQQRPNPDYLPVAASESYQPPAVQTLPQVAAPVYLPMPAVYMDYSHYPYVNNKQLADRSPRVTEDEVPSQYV